MKTYHHYTIGLSAALLAVGCYTDLEDEGEYKSIAVNSLPRSPNQAPTTGAQPDDGTEPPPPGDTTAPPDDGMGGSGGGEPVMNMTLADLLPAGCEDVPGTIFGASGKCGGIACHGSPGTAPIASIDLGANVADLQTRVVNLPGAGDCASWNIVDTADPASSLLITKLSDTPPCGAKMPVTGMVTADEVACITAWVEAVAQLAQ